MEEEKLIFAKLDALKPESIIDVGCGSGEFTNELGAYADGVTGIDIDEEQIREAKGKNKRANVRYYCDDILTIPFPAGIYEACVCRFSLHHMHDWQRAIDQMVRITRSLVVIEEPFFDLRSDEKKRTYEVTKVFLDLHREVGFSHSMYLEPAGLLQYLEEKKLSVETGIERSNELLTFDDYFGRFERFAEKSTRKDFWKDKIEHLRTEYKGRVFCDDDILYAFCMKASI